MKKEKKKASRTRKILFRLLSASLACVIGCIGIYFAALHLDFKKVVYGSLMKHYEDSHSETFLETNARLAGPITHYSSTFTTFRTVSSALTQKIEYLAPSLLYVRLPNEEAKKAKSISREYRSTKERFQEGMLWLDNDIRVSTATSPITINTYFQSYLPRYLDYINAKFKMSSFIDRVLINAGLMNDSMKNVAQLSGVLIDFGVTFALPSIILRDARNITPARDADFEKPLMGGAGSTIHLTRIIQEFNDVITLNKYPTDTTVITNFENELKNILTIYGTAKGIWENMLTSDKNNYLASDK
ncbi:MAG: hypothetical protein FWD32_02745, partial [Firmicutes bacterium]|nr:hypothetical protein [Bacillota bacterium]